MPKENKKEEAVKITVARVYDTENSPYYQKIEAIVQETREGKKKRKPNGTQVLWGWLPSYSPAIDYTVTINDKKQIIKRDEWKRNNWWLTEEVVGPILEGHLDKRVVDRIASFFKTPVSSERETQENQKFEPIRTLFARHFYPDLWFDLSTIQRDGSNVYTPHTLERCAPQIINWQKRMNDDLFEGFLMQPLPVSHLTWPIVSEICNKAQAHHKDGMLNEDDKILEKRLINKQEMEQLIGASPKGIQIDNMEYPLISSHGFLTLPPSLELLFDFVVHMRRYTKVSQHPLFEHRLEHPEARKIMEQKGFLFEISPHVWITFKHLLMASHISNFMDKYIYEENPLPIVKSVDSLANVRSCVVSCMGLGHFSAIETISNSSELLGPFAFHCPNRELSKLLLSEIDVLSEPMEKRGNETPKTLVFCFAGQFSLSKMAGVMSTLSYKPERVLFVADVVVTFKQGIGSPLDELLELGRIPIFEFRGKYEPNAGAHEQMISIAQSLDVPEFSRLPWSSKFQLCSPERFEEMYKKLVESRDPDGYHILCDDKATLEQYAQKIRVQAPHGVSVYDKVWLPEEKKLDWIADAYPEEERTNKPAKTEIRKDMVLVNRKSHKAKLGIEKFTDHSKCCKMPSARPGTFNVVNHKMQWANIQLFRDCVIPKREHSVIIISRNTRIKHVEMLARTTVSTLTILGTISDINVMLARKIPNPNRSLLSYTSSREKRVTI